MKDKGGTCRRTNVGDGGLLADQVFTTLQGLVQHVQDTLDLVDVAIDGGLDPLAVKVLEPGALTELSKVRNKGYCQRIRPAALCDSGRQKQRTGILT